MMNGQTYAYDGVLGGKTGYTEAAGNTLVTYAKNDNTYLVAVVLQSVNVPIPTQSITGLRIQQFFQIKDQRFEKRNLQILSARGKISPQRLQRLYFVPADGKMPMFHCHRVLM